MAEAIDVHRVFAEYFPKIKPWAYAVSEALSEGSICVNTEVYKTDVESGIKVNPCISEDELLDLRTLDESDFVTSNPAIKLSPFVLEEGKFLYMQRYFEYQARIAEKINRLVEAEKKKIPARLKWLTENKKLIHDIFETGHPVSDDGLDDIEKIDWQKVAALNSCLHNFSIITGGPGTGKTTTVAKILAILYNQIPELKVALAAPTGKAAARLGESLRNSIALNSELKRISDRIETLVPKTIHRLLESLPMSSLFRHNSENPLGHDLVIIDEASMVDVALMCKLLDSVHSENRIIFLGDMNQLSSVEAGSIFGDLCKTQETFINHLSPERMKFCNEFLDRQIPSDMVLDQKNENPLSQHVIHLLRNYRTESKEITKACKLIVNREKGKLLKLLDSYQEIKMGDAFKPEAGKDHLGSQLEAMALAYIDYITEPDIKEALKKLKSFRVLCAIREGGNGVYKMNKKIEQLLKSRVNQLFTEKKISDEFSNETENQELFNPSGTFYHNQAIMVTSNNYELDVFNGDVGLVRRKSKDDPTLIAWFESADPEKPRAILPGYLNEWETVFAMTIHKSQGSEFDSVAVILPENENNRILTKELLYTAVSRARKNLLLKSCPTVLEAATDREVNRASGITRLF